ncbi:hypothetical protein LguiB_031205 [Lonicera macranthoides]
MFPPRFNLVLRSTFRQSSRRSMLVWMGILVHSIQLSLKFTFSSHKIYLLSNSNSYVAPKKNNPIRVKIKLHIKITAVDDNKNSSGIHVKGKSLFSNEHVKASVFHTLEIKNKEFNLVKQNWDEDSINSLTEASNRTNKSYLAVVLMQEGLAHIFSVGWWLAISNSFIIKSPEFSHGNCLRLNPAFNSSWYALNASMLGACIPTTAMALFIYVIATCSRPLSMRSFSFEVCKFIYAGTCVIDTKSASPALQETLQYYGQ